MNELIRPDDESLSKDFEAIQDPTPEFSMRHFVVGQHHTKGQQWAQTTLELQNRAFAVAIHDIEAEIQLTKIDGLEGNVSIAEAKQKIRLLKAKKIRLEIRSAELARIGTVRGIEHLVRIKNELESEHEGRGWSREELDGELAEYWGRRLSWQAAMDLNATGRVGVGNQDALRMARMPIPGQPTYVQQVEQKFLATDKTRLLIATPTLIQREEIERDWLRCWDGWSIPHTIQQRRYVINGKTIDAAYADAALTAMEDGATHLLCVEDDHVIPAGTFERIWELHQRSGHRSICGAWYPQRKEPRTGAPIIARDGRRDYLSDDGDVHEVYSIPQGFTLIPVSVFSEIPQPWFVTTGALSQDSFFSQLAREAGYKLLVDTGARIKHVDRATGRVYE